MVFPPDCPLTIKLKESQDLFEEIKKKSIERLKFEERLKDPKLIDPGSIYY
jgi:hypothetical protein